MAIFNSYVKLPEGIYHYSPDISSPDISPDIFTIATFKNPFFRCSLDQSMKLKGSRWSVLHAAVHWSWRLPVP